MKVNRVNHLERISPEDWEKTPISVKFLIPNFSQTELKDNFESQKDSFFFLTEKRECSD
jgi:hypothetical protein